MEASKLAAFRQKLEADAAAAAAKGAAPTMMPMNDKKSDVLKWKKSADVRVGFGSPNGIAKTRVSTEQIPQGTPKIEKADFRRSISSPTGSLSSKPKVSAGSSDPSTPTELHKRKLKRNSIQQSSGSDLSKLPAGPALTIPSTPSEAKKKLGGVGALNVSPSAGGGNKYTKSPGGVPKPRLSVPGISPVRGRPSITMGKPSEVKAAMQKEKQIARAPRRRLKSSPQEAFASETADSTAAAAVAEEEVTTTKEERKSRSKSPGDRPPRSKSPGLRPSRSNSPGSIPSRSNSPGTIPSRSSSPGPKPQTEKDEDDELMAIVDEADRHKTNRQNVMNQMNSLAQKNDSSGSNKRGRPDGKRMTPMRRMSSNRKLMGTAPSNRVPEMRRRAAPQDLSMFAGEKKKEDDDEGEATETAASGESGGSGGVKKQKDGDGKKARTDAELHHQKLQAETVAKIKNQQEAKLEEAKEAFQKGHDLCWKENKPLYALGKYRIALFIRESNLGKYHEDTGRTYYWIGRSLIKLRDFEEALVALSRSLRIFERTLFSKHKYNKWASGAVDICFDEMGVDKESAEDYKLHLNASIQHERNGDRLRKLGKNTEAIAEYRNAIDAIEEYSPDAADLYCKIALILRSEDEFERALEEYGKASQIYQLSLGADHPDTVNALNQLIEKKRMNQLSLALQEKLDLRKS